MLKAVAPLLLALGIIVATPVGAAADGFVLDTRCRRVSVENLEYGVTVCPTGS